MDLCWLLHWHRRLITISHSDTTCEQVDKFHPVRPAAGVRCQLQKKHKTRPDKLVLTPAAPTSSSLLCWPGNSVYIHCRISSSQRVTGWLKEEEIRTKISFCREKIMFILHFEFCSNLSNFFRVNYWVVSPTQAWKLQKQKSISPQPERLCFYGSHVKKINKRCRTSAPGCVVKTHTFSLASPKHDQKHVLQ